MMWFDSRTVTVGLRLAAVLTLVGCAASQQPPETLPPQTMSPVAAPPEATPQPEPAPPARPVDRAPADRTETDEAGGKDDHVVVIDTGETSPAKSVSLIEASRQEQERRATADAPEVVITNENLSEHATGDVTFAQDQNSDATGGDATGSAGVPAPSPEDEVTEQEPAGSEDDVRGEEYWRQRGLEIRLAWRDEVERIGDLEGEIFQLRQRFYAEDDPFYRDGQIKPAWDLALERMEQSRLAARGYEEDLQAYFEEGRRAGALPGWLREGVEIEPRPLTEVDTGPEYEPGEPEILEENEGGRV